MSASIPEPKRRRTAASGIVLAGIVVLGALLAVGHRVASALPFSFITGYCLQSGGSIPTLLVGECLEARTKAFRDRLPQHGELVVLRIPSEPDVDFVKRVIGLPGDRVQLREGRLYLNGALIDQLPLRDEEAAPLVRDFPSARVFREMMPGSAGYLIAEIGDFEDLETTPEFTVPADHVFVLGDNRDRSNDSRTKMGFIPISGVRDKPLFIFWSSDTWRIGKAIE